MVLHSLYPTSPYPIYCFPLCVHHLTPVGFLWFSYNSYPRFGLLASQVLAYAHSYQHRPGHPGHTASFMVHGPRTRTGCCAHPGFGFFSPLSRHWFRTARFWDALAHSSLSSPFAWFSRFINTQVSGLALDGLALFLFQDLSLVGLSAGPINCPSFSAHSHLAWAPDINKQLCGFFLRIGSLLPIPRLAPAPVD